MRAARWTLALALAACAPEIPDATYVCTSSAQCPPGLTCFGGLCVREPGDAGSRDAGPCTPTTDCAALRAECGSISDGCGGTVECGTCDNAFDTCSLRIENICDCEPVGCAIEQCGLVDNGCGGLVECGGCDANQNCVAQSCACTPEVCGDRCGMIPDGCGSPLDCAACRPPEVCGGGGPNVCGSAACTPTTCLAEGKDCGSISDDCGLTLSCGTCSGEGVTCGGGASSATPNVCGCTPQTCGDLPRETCGDLTERCGVALSCGGCLVPGETCGGGGVANTCGCAPGPEEPNESDTTARAKGTLRSPDSASVLDATLHDDADTDWFVYEVGDTGVADLSTTVGAALSRLPVFARYYVSVSVDCEGSGTVTCVVGQPLGSVGCTSRGLAVSEAEAVLLQTTCEVTRIFVNVGQTRFGVGCAPYQLDVALDPPLP